MRSRRFLWMSLAALLPAAALSAAPTIPGAEQRINQRQNLQQRHPVAAFTPSGAALVVWDNDLVGLQGRFFGRDGVPQGEELTLVAYEGLTLIPSEGEVTLRRDPALAVLPSGAFLLFWTEERAFDRVDYFIQSHQVLDQDVFGQRFDAAGHPAGARFQVNASTAGFQSAPRVAVRGNDVIVVWSAEDDQVGLTAGDGVFARRFDRFGHALAGEVKVSATGEPAAQPAVAAASNGRFLVAWEGNDGDSQGVFAQLFDAAAAPLGGVFRVNSDIAGFQRRPAVAASRAGDFLVVWQGFFQVRGRARIYGQSVGAAGNLVGGQLTVSGGSVPAEVSPAVGLGRGDHFVVAWLGYDQIFPVGVFAVELDRDGSALGEVQKLNRRALNANTRLAIAADGNGGFVVPWEGFTQRRAGISAQRLFQP